MNAGRVLIEFSLFGFFISLCRIYEKSAVIPDAMIDSLDNAAQSAAVIANYPSNWVKEMKTKYSKRVYSVVMQAQAEKERAAKAAYEAERAAYEKNLAETGAAEQPEAETGHKNKGNVGSDLESLSLSNPFVPLLDGRKKEKTTFASAITLPAKVRGISRMQWTLTVSMK